MNCCSNCFKDYEIKSYIHNNSTQKGNCDYCKLTDTDIIPTIELLVFFETLLASYSIVNDAELFDSSDDYVPLHAHLAKWNIFELDNAQQIIFTNELASSMFQGADLTIQRLVPKILLSDTYRTREQEFIDRWNDFKSEIINTNRYIIQNSIDLDILKNIINSFEKKYKKEKRFFRARISDVKGLSADLMGRPPAKFATAGRANPKGISYLYLSNNEETTLYEVRATLNDYVTIAEFRLTEEIKVVSLRKTNEVSPFVLDDIDIYLSYKRLINLLEKDLMTPLRRSDSELEYIPTQYLCEFIKSLGYNGVEYSSSLNPNGFNIALFDDIQVECMNVQTFDVKNISYIYEVVY